MAWNIFEGLEPDAHQALEEYADLRVPTGQAVIEALAWCKAGQEPAYIQRALQAGLRPTPDQAAELLLRHWPEGHRFVLPATHGTFTADQALDIAGGIDDDREAAGRLPALGWNGVL